MPKNNEIQALENYQVLKKTIERVNITTEMLKFIDNYNKEENTDYENK